MNHEDQNRWVTPDMIDYGSVEEVTSDEVKYYGSDDGINLGSSDGPSIGYGS